MKTTKQILGEQLRLARTGASLSISQLADKMHTSRSHITEIEEGSKNLTADLYDKLLHACSASAETVFAGINTSDIPREHQDLYWMLGVIVKSDDKDLLFGLRTTMSAITEKAIRLSEDKKRKKTG